MGETLQAHQGRAAGRAELARHFRERQAPALAPAAVERALYALSGAVEALLDLRQPAVRSAPGLRGGAPRFLDAEVAHATATFIRRTTSTQALAEFARRF